MQEAVCLLLGDLTIQVGQVVVQTHKRVKGDPGGTPLLILRQDLTRKLQRADDGLHTHTGKCTDTHSSRKSTGHKDST